MCTVTRAFGLWRKHFGGLARELEAAQAIQAELSANGEVLEGYLKVSKAENSRLRDQLAQEGLVLAGMERGQDFFHV